MFAIWDWMFGTLILPTDEIRENMVLGIDPDEPQRHPTLTRAYLEPLERMYWIVRNGFRSLPVSKSQRRLSSSDTD